MTDPISRLNAALEGRYRIERELGAGGMATVYLAADLKHEGSVARAGSTETLDLPPADYGGVRLSPDGERLAITVYEGRASTIVIHDLERRVTRRLDGGGIVNRDAYERGSRVSARTDDRFRVETFHVVLSFVEEIR